MSGFPVYISKQVAQARDPLAQAAVAHRALVLMAWIGFAMFAVLELGADLIARAMADAGLAPIVRSVGLMFLTMPVLSAARGYFQGTFDMTKTAISQVVEQLLRVGVILLAAGVAVQHAWGPYKMAAWAMTGAFIGGLGATLVILPAYLKASRGFPHAATPLSEYGHLFDRFVKEGGSIALFFRAADLASTRGFLHGHARADRAGHGPGCGAGSEGGVRPRPAAGAAGVGRRHFTFDDLTPQSESLGGAWALDGV
ncbi:oligosaccharide flippase family protein [Lacticaseibacillus camelliae]|uniref:oligosaccharide flippase family protein n=1 Tax=Lacticaseibacillus camelliae TaxID=381742 RepID=UPI0034E1FDA1